MGDGSSQVTRLLQLWSDGDKLALEELAPIVFQELHRLAHRYMSGEKKGHLLQTTALINEAYIRLTGLENLRVREGRVGALDLHAVRLGGDFRHAESVDRGVQDGAEHRRDGRRRVDLHFLLA